MSTKTSIKRIAAVAAVALTLGGFSAVSAHAAANSVLKYVSGDSNVAETNTASGVAGAFNYVTLQTVAPAADYVVTTTSTFGAITASTAAVVSADKTSFSATVAATAIQVMTPTVGTITVSYWVRTAGILASTAAETYTINVNAAAQSGKYNAGKSSAYIVGSDTSTATATTDAVAVTVSQNALTNKPSAVVLVSDLDALGNGVADTITATVSGPATVKAIGTTWTPGSLTAGTYSATLLTTSGSGNGVAYFGIYPNGQTGTATITFTNSANVVLATKTVAFSSTTVASIVATNKTTYIVKSNGASTAPAVVSGALASGETYNVSMVLKDASGAVVTDATGGAVTVTSADTTKVSAGYCSAPTSKGVVYCKLATGSVYGAVDVTFSTGSTAAGTKVSAVKNFTVVSAQAATFTITADASVAQGGLITYTVTAKDANGFPIPDGSLVTTYVSSPVVSGGAQIDYSSIANGGTTYNQVNALFTNVKFAAGVATDTVLAPFGAASIKGDFTLEGTGVAADGILTAALQATEPILVTAVDGGPAAAAAQAAVDAANEATDAANAATDAANNAMDSADAAQQAALDAGDKADAALAAVTDLATKVSAIATQIAALSALVKKIAAKVKA
jgi:hypothetical protein